MPKSCSGPISNLTDNLISIFTYSFRPLTSAHNFQCNCRALRVTTYTITINVEIAVGERTVPGEELRLVLTVLQGKQWQQEEELLDQHVVGVSLNFLSELLCIKFDTFIMIFITGGGGGAYVKNVRKVRNA